MTLSFKRLAVAVAALLLWQAALPAPASAREDGYELWLRYRPLEAPYAERYRASARSLVVAGDSPTLRAARHELETGLAGLLGRTPRRADRVEDDGAIFLGTPASPLIRSLALPLGSGPEAFVLRTVRIAGRRTTIIAGNSDIGALYGAFAYLRLIQMRQPARRLNRIEAPRYKLRLLNHWDNLDRTVERGYAGASIWDWEALPGRLDPRYTDYARANASIGINGTVLTNVNANAQVLTPAYLRKVAALAGVFRPYGIRTWLTARFSAPIEIGGLRTADPLDPKVRAWWKAKAAEIYRAVPDFGGFLVKANSEGQPGPQDYGRSHAEGANMLAEALAPHGGKVMWRAFVYTATPGEDRARQAFREFKALDGRFAPNVIVQVKNGPIDFQPREPFHPLFGAMRSTPLAMEVQITKEYLGFSTHLAYLGTMWEEVLREDTHARGPGTPVSATIDAMAGVANIGSDRNWSGSHFDQANWYAFGRLAWAPQLPAREIAGEWARMTFSNDPRFLRPALAMMMRSRQAVADYMTPLGLHHLMNTDHHYGPGPWVNDLSREDWNPTYYHRADARGIGFDRTASGSNAVADYSPEVARRYGDLGRVPEDLLLWFHHVPWGHPMRSGRTLWDELVLRYGRGVAEVRRMRAAWARLRPFVDGPRHADVAASLATQEREAQWWRDASIAYFQSVSGRPLPRGAAPPPRGLDWYKAEARKPPPEP
jgi:alpha-glucuronidase